MNVLRYISLDYRKNINWLNGLNSIYCMTNMATTIIYKPFLIAITISCLFCSLSLSAAQISNDAVSRKQPLKEDPHSKEYFLNKYGKDDSSRALIEFFFRKEHQAKKETVWWGIIGTIAFVLFIAVIDSTANLGIVGLLLGINLGVIAYGAIIRMAIGIFKWIRFRKKRLEKLLDDYNAGKGIPRNIKRNRTFKTELSFERKESK